MTGPSFRAWATASALVVTVVLVAILFASEVMAPDPHPIWAWHSRTCPHGELGLGEWLTTDVNTTAELEIAQIGKMILDPNTRVRLVESDVHQRVEVAQGTVHAIVNAPPREFVVDTPSATVLDLGCAYVITVDALGATHLDVTVGLVEVVAANRVARVPAGASVVSYLGTGLATPRFRDSGPSFVAALDAWDASHDRAALEALLAATSRPRDDLSLLHVQQFVGPDERRLILERLGAR